ncbi:GtrA family protein [Komagataeibacter sp. NFXK3]
MKNFGNSVDHLFRFLLVGGISTIVNYGVFLILFEKCGHQYQVASVCGFLTGVAVGFPLNKKWTYKVNFNNKSCYFCRYGIIYFIYLLVNLYVLKFSVKSIGMDARIANCISIIVTTIINFIGTKFWAFRV